MHPIIALILRYPDTLLSRDSLIDYLVESDLQTKDEMIETSMVRPGKLFTERGNTQVVTEVKDGKLINYEPIDLPKGTKVEPRTKFILEPGMIANHKEGNLETTFGRYFLNYVLLVDTFGDVIPYINDSPLKLNKIESIIAAELIEGRITPQQTYKYIDSAYMLSSLNDLLVPSITFKTMTSRPEVNKRRDELLKLHKDELDDPKVMLAIENELVALDKAALVGDPSNGVMIESKNYVNHRKRMFLAVGAVPAFGDESHQLDFAKTNLNDGWKLEELDILSNDIRNGSYSRAKNTATVGVITKSMGRRFQESQIVEDDCGTDRGIQIRLLEHNKHHYLHRNLIAGSKLVELTSNNVDSYLGKEVVIRSPMYCKSTDGYCYTCMDTRFRKSGLKMLNLAPTNVGSVLLNASMKAMHTSALAAFQLDDLDRFVI